MPGPPKVTNHLIDVTLIILCLFAVLVRACTSNQKAGKAHFEIIIHWNVLLFRYCVFPAGEYMVIRKTDSDSNKMIVELGEDALLFCRTNAPWKKCSWRPPRSGVKQVELLLK